MYKYYNPLYLTTQSLNVTNMNPYSPEQQYPLYIVKEALARCLQERENAEFLIETKQQLIEIVQQGYSMMHDLDQEIVLPNGVVLPSPRQILDHDVQFHTAVIERQKALLEDILKCEEALRNGIRRHTQSHETYNMRRIIEKQQRYDRYHKLQNDLIKLEGDLKSLNQDLDQDLKRLNQLRDQATTSSYNNSASLNND